MRSDLISRRSVLAGAAVLAVGAGRALSQANAPVVVELFTSQGCSSCPPADALMKELRRMPGVVALAYHVDYWDYLGWKDTLGNAANSQRQYDYAKSRGDMDVYTPQIIVNGGDHVVGSDRPAVLGAIAAARAVKLPVALTIADGDMDISVAIGAGTHVPEATLWMMGVLPVQSVKMMRGENSGQIIAYYRTVRTATPAGMWSGAAMTVKLPKDGLLANGCKACVAMLQLGKVGPVLGVAQWGDPDA